MVQTYKLPEMLCRDIFIHLDRLKRFWNISKSGFFVIFNSNFQSFLTFEPETDETHEFRVAQCPVNGDSNFFLIYISGGYKQLNPALCVRNLKFRTHVYDEVYFHYRSGGTLVPAQNHPWGVKHPQNYFWPKYCKIRRSTEKYWQKVVQRSSPYQNMPENAGPSAYFHISGWKVVQEEDNMQLTLSELCILRYKTEILYTYLW